MVQSINTDTKGTDPLYCRGVHIIEEGILRILDLLDQGKVCNREVFVSRGLTIYCFIVFLTGPQYGSSLQILQMF